MDNMLQIVKDAKIFDNGSVFVFSDEKSRSCDLDSPDVLFLIRNEAEVVRGLQYYVNYMAQDKLLEIVSCKQITPLCFEFEVAVYERDNGRILKKDYLHKLHTLQDRIAEDRERFDEDPELALTKYP